MTDRERREFLKQLAKTAVYAAPVVHTLAAPVDVVGQGVLPSKKITPPTLAPQQQPLPPNPAPGGTPPWQHPPPGSRRP